MLPGFQKQYKRIIDMLTSASYAEREKMAAWVTGPENILGAAIMGHFTIRRELHKGLFTGTAYDENG